MASGAAPASAPPPRLAAALPTAPAAVLALLVSTCPVALPAQTLELGLTAGLNRATVAWEATPLGNGFETVEHRTSFRGGLTVALRVGDRLSLRGELLRTGKGFREVEAAGDDTVLDLTYLELPVLFGVRFPMDGPVEPELYAGPYLARETGCEVSGTVDGQALAFDCDEIPGEDVLRRETEWGGVVGVALRLGNPAGPRLVFDVRYTRGLRNVDAGPEVDNFDIRHRGLAAVVGLSVPVGL